MRGRIGLIEAHGTGTVVGDCSELATISELFASEGAAPGSCAIGSVKSQIAHTKGAAGVAGIIKAALALWTGVRPPIARAHASEFRSTASPRSTFRFAFPRRLQPLRAVLA